MKRGFILGKFMPPHAGHVSICEAATAMVDELTILVCSLPQDEIPGGQRVRWMKELFPAARVRWVNRDVPQAPEESPEFWTIWTDIVAEAHPEPIDMVFAGEAYGRDLAARVGGRFVPLGGRIQNADPDGLGGVSATLVREDPARHWRWLPAPVRRDWVKVVALYGIESVGKTTLAGQLAERLGTSCVPEYGRAHCDMHGGALSSEDLVTIAQAQQAMIDAAKRWSGPLLIADTDWLMTDAWHRMLLDARLPELGFPQADLYLHLPPDLPWTDDGTRFFSDERERRRFHEICRATIEHAGVRAVFLTGSPSDRVERAVAAIEDL